MTVEREVLITLKVAAHSKNSSAAKAVAAEIEKANKAAGASHAKMTNSVVGNLDRFEKSSKQTLSKIQKLEESHAAEIKKLRGEVAKQSEQLHRQEVAIAKSAAAEKAKAEEQAQSKYEGLVDKQMSSQKALGESVKAGLGGATQLAGGLLQLGIIGEENLEKFVKGFATVQAGINAVSGGITVFFALRDGMNAYREATLAAAAAQKVLAVSQASGGASGVASTVTGAATSTAGKVGSSAAAGVAGGAGIKGVAAAGAAGAKTLGILAAKAVAIAGAADLAQAGVTKAANAMGLTSRESETMTGALLSWRAASKAAAESTEALSKAESRREKLKAEQVAGNQSIEEKSRFASEVRASRAGIAGRIDAVGGASEKEIVERERLRALSELDQAMAEVAAAEERRMQRQKAGQFALSADSIQAAERLKAATESRETAEEKLLTLSKGRLDTQKSIVSQAKSELEAAKQAVATANDQVDGALGRFSKLGKGTQNKLKEISDRVKRGEQITGADADILEKAGFGGDLVKQKRKEQGEAAGGREVLSGLGELDGQAEAVKRRDQLAGELQQQQKKEVEITKEIIAAQKRYQKSIDALSEANEKLLQTRADAAGTNLAPASVGGAGVEGEVAQLGETITGAIRNANDQVRRTQERIAAAGDIT